MNPTDTHSRSWRKDENQSQVNKILSYRIRLLTAITLGVIAGVCWWVWQSESKYVGKFYLLLTPISSQESEVEFTNQVKLLRSSQVLKPILDKFLVQEPDLNNSTKSPLTIKQLSNTKIVEVAYVNPDPLKIQLLF